jgi:hypothetical protein
MLEPTYEFSMLYIPCAYLRAVTHRQACSWHKSQEVLVKKDK